MKIRSFKGTGIRGYMDFDITFNDGVSFLIGINGSGKTTVLKLISGLITPSYVDLLQIEFIEIELSIEIQANTTICIKCNKKNNSLVLFYNDEKAIFSILSAQNNNVNYPPEYMFERLRNEMIHFEEDKVVKKIKDLNTPLFLGLNRTIKHLNSSGIDRFSIGRRSTNMDLLLESDYVDMALKEIQDRFNQIAINNTQKQYQLHNNFRTMIFEESFTVSEMSYNEVHPIDYTEELRRIELKEQDYNTTMEMLGLNKIEKKSQRFFEKMKHTLETLKKTPSLEGMNNQPLIRAEYYDALFNWLMNYKQLERIDQIIKYANDYSKNIQKLKDPFIRFADSVNTFFSEGKKEIIIEDSGDIKALISDNKKKKNSIYELSSGEKQLIIILAHIAFYKEINRKSAPIFIIDEPELSLHISWQEKFVDALLKANPDTQFIMATHAPSIIAKTERKKLCIDLTAK